MSTTVGTIQYDVRLNLKQLKADSKAAEKIVNSTSSSVENSSSEAGSQISSMFGKITTAAKVAGLAVGAALIGATTFAFKSAASFEQTRVGLENMLGSTDAARLMLQKVSKFAADTPFEFPELADTVRQLVAFGFTGKDAFNTMKNLGDVSAAIGAPMSDLAYLMGTLKTQGRAFTIDIRQFAQRGIPIYEYLGKVLNKTTKEITELIEEGKIGFPEVEKAFAAMTGEGGKFYKTMDNQSQTLNGRISTLKDIIGQTARQVVGLSDTGDVIKGGLFDKVTVGVKELTDSLPQIVQTTKDVINRTIQFGKSIGAYLQPKVIALWNSIDSKLIPALTDLWKRILQPMVAVFGTALLGAVGATIDVFNGLIRVLSPVIRWLNNNRSAVMGLVTALGALWVAMKVRQGFMAVDAALAALRMSFVVQTVATVGFTNAIGAASLALKGFLVAVGPVGWAIGLVTVAVGLLGFAFGKAGEQADRQRSAQERLKAATDALKDSKDRLRESELGVEGANLRLERAQLNLKTATEQYGAESLEAREASLELKRALQDVKEAHDEAAEATHNHKEAEKEYANSGGLIESAESKMRAMQGLADVLGRTVFSGPIIAQPRPIGQRSTTGGFPTGADILKSFGRNANGTNHWKGGPTWVGERGPEILNLPKGSQIVPNYKSGVGSNVNITLNMDGIMARSRTDLRDIARDMLQAINEELRAKGKTELAI